MNEGTYSLTKNDGSADLALAGPGTIICEVIKDLDGITDATIDCRLEYGAGGSTLSHYVQTSFDDGATWIDVYNFEPGLATTQRIVNVTGRTPITTPLTPTDGGLAANTVKDGVVGPRWRTKTVTTGTFTGSTAIRTRLRAA